MDWKKNGEMRKINEISGAISWKKSLQNIKWSSGTGKKQTNGEWKGVLKKMKNEKRKQKKNTWTLAKYYKLWSI